jgi:hypothetical protein
MKVSKNQDGIRISTTVNVRQPEGVIESFHGAMAGVIYGAERNPERLNVQTAFCELIIDGVEYQGQIHLVADKAAWMGEDEYRFSEIVKIHK